MKVKAFKNDPDKRKQLVAHLLTSPRDLLVTLIMLNIVVNILIQNVTSSIFGDLSGWALNVGVPLGLTLIFGEVIPKSIGMANNSAISYRVAPFLNLARRFFHPICKVITSLTGAISRLMFFFLKSEEEISFDELQHAFGKTSRSYEILNEDEAELVRGYLILQESQVKELMRPREEVLFFDMEDPLSKLVHLFVDQECSRIPVCKESLDNVLGIITSRIFFMNREKLHKTSDLTAIIKKPLFVPEGMAAEILLKQMYEKEESLALVVDEYGSISGLIALEDLVEKVVGEIADARDVKSRFTRSGDDVIIASGKLELSEFSDIFGHYLPSENNMVTIGGWLTEQMGDIPKTVTKYTAHGFFFHVLAADVKRDPPHLYPQAAEQEGGQMSESWKFFLLMILLCMATQGFFAMMEMACVSFNKVRLQYYVSKQNKRAVWLSDLLHKPALLFGTTLIGVNTSLIVGSECARRFYDSLGDSPDWAALSQILHVLIFAEICTYDRRKRRYAEHVAMLGHPAPLFFLDFASALIIWALDMLCRMVNRLIGKPVASGVYLSREELQNVIEEREMKRFPPSPRRKEFNTVVANIFSLKAKTAKDLMLPLTHVPLVPSFCTVKQMRDIVKDKNVSCLCPFITARPKTSSPSLFLRDLLRLSENKKVKDYSRQPWFITENSSVLQILKQFRRNNQSLAIVLNEKGLATGVLSLDEVIDEIFGRSDQWESYGEVLPKAYHIVIDRTFESDMLLKDFNAQFNVHLSYQDAETLEEVMTLALGHSPSKGESVRIDQFELTVEEASILGAKMIEVRTVF